MNISIDNQPISDLEAGTVFHFRKNTDDKLYVFLKTTTGFVNLSLDVQFETAQFYEVYKASVPYGAIVLNAVLKIKL